MSFSFARVSPLIVIVVHLDLDLASSFAARNEPFLLFDASASAASNGTDVDAAETNAGSSLVAAAVDPVTADTDRVSCTDSDTVDMDEASDVDDVVDPTDLDDVKPGRPAVRAGIVRGPSFFTVGFTVLLPVETGVFVLGLKGEFWAAMCVCASCASSQWWCGHSIPIGQTFLLI